MPREAPVVARALVVVALAGCAAAPRVPPAAFDVNRAAPQGVADDEERTSEAWIELPLVIFFSGDSTEIDDDAREVLGVFHDSLRHRTDVVGYRLTGFAGGDDDSSEFHQLAHERAEVVADHLAEHWGVPRDTIEVSGIGGIPMGVIEHRDRRLLDRVEFAMRVRRVR